MRKSGTPLYEEHTCEWLAATVFHLVVLDTGSWWYTRWLTDGGSAGSTLILSGTPVLLLGSHCCSVRRRRLWSERGSNTSCIEINSQLPSFTPSPPLVWSAAPPHWTYWPVTRPHFRAIPPHTPKHTHTHSSWEISDMFDQAWRSNSIGMAGRYFL